MPAARQAPQPFGTTVNSFTSVSLDPPLVLITIGRERSIHPVLARTGRFAVNILAEGAQELSDCFAGAPSAIPRTAFCGAGWHPSAQRHAATWTRRSRGSTASWSGSSRPATTPSTWAASPGWRSSDSNDWPLLYFRRRYLRIEHAETAELRGKPDKT